MDNTKTYMALDQYGETFHDLGSHPRKALLDKLGKTTARKMYVDTKSGRSLHIGWVIGSHWLTVYEVSRMEKITRKEVP